MCCHRVSSKYDTQVSYFIGRQFNCFLAEKRMKGRILGRGGGWIRISFNNGLLHLKTVSPTPTGWAHNFTSYSWRLNKTAITHEDLKTAWFLPLKNMVVPWKIIFTSKEFHLMYFYSTPLSLCNLTLKNFICQVNQWRGGMDFIIQYNTIAQ